MCTCEETSKSQLRAIRHAMSQISSLRARAIYLRKMSQENHVKRMQLARTMGEPLSPVFILPSSSPVREPKRTQNELPDKLKSPNKIAMKEDDKKATDKTFHKCKVINQKKEKTFKSCKPEVSKNVSKVKDDKINTKVGKPNEISKSTVKSTLSLGRFSKREKLKRKETEKKLPKNKVRKDKNQNKKSPKKISIFYGESPTAVTIELAKGDDNAFVVNCDGAILSPKLSPNESSNPEKSTENASDKTASTHMLLNSLNPLYDGEGKEDDNQNNKKFKMPLKKIPKKKSKGLPRNKANSVKPSQNKEKKIKVSKNKDLLKNVNQTSLPKKDLNPSTALSTLIKKDSSFFSRSLSLDSLDDQRKPLQSTISPSPRTIDNKVRNFINDKKDMINISLENNSQGEKMANNSELQSLKPYSLASGSKIPVHEFRACQTRSQEKVNEILGEPFHDRFRTKGKNGFADNCNENTDDILPLVNPFKSKKSIVKSWLKSVPEVSQTSEKSGKKAREFIPNSINFITANSVCETSKQMVSKNGASAISENREKIPSASKNLPIPQKIKLKKVMSPRVVLLPVQYHFPLQVQLL
ncbi:hypothetical protein HNY73_000855 [Argiope bruennichi]|uniref:Uncharacterized protein n=1 Tax=Argiope bruennichi TaxID=94029 RepID=A0A8T0G1V0_ARGBR|nr:hypothetical protein HNY73_000855 [Argiope bruennichi]